jgi:antirestriction protein ArdC
LHSATTKPGTLQQAYSNFWNYSSGNQMLALMQCAMRGIEPGPIASYRRWQELGRQVRKGQKALSLWMPITVKRTKPENDGESADDSQRNSSEAVTTFVVRNNWFVLSQTDGKPYTPPTAPGWNRDDALFFLDVHLVPFDLPDGNVQGYAQGRNVAINPLAGMPEKTLFHELGHILLGHTGSETMADLPTLSRNQKEMEAEAVALICLESLGLPGCDACRGYIQHWYGTGNSIPEANARRIFQAADKILKAGQSHKPEGGAQ